jgi:hypothetical protein
MKLSADAEKSNFKRSSSFKKSVLPLFSFNANKMGYLFLPISRFGSNCRQMPSSQACSTQRERKDMY